eukprot:TRINITY_DN2128_c0_g2_i5.p1 TRINITY_DN2128_c0_g2~~TRINITY_DN2128_c0_g2_i5.p1  ORF type:complete len:106 (+),score=5.85 TRINITY_DN2128_c0_g2_i5:25-318(+)
MIRRPPRSTHCISSAASDVYKRQLLLRSLPVLSYPSPYFARRIHCLRRCCTRMTLYRLAILCTLSVLVVIHELAFEIRLKWFSLSSSYRYVRCSSRL